MTVLVTTEAPGAEESHDPSVAVDVTVDVTVWPTRIVGAFDVVTVAVTVSVVADDPHSSWLSPPAAAVGAIAGAGWVSVSMAVAVVDSVVVLLLVPSGMILVSS